MQIAGSVVGSRHEPAGVEGTNSGSSLLIHTTSVVEPASKSNMGPGEVQVYVASVHFLFHSLARLQNCKREFPESSCVEIMVMI